MAQAPKMHLPQTEQAIIVKQQATVEGGTTYT
jgi:hypothetical protein